MQKLGGALEMSEWPQTRRNFRLFAAKLRRQKMGFLARRSALSFTPDLVSDLGLRHGREGKRLFIESGEGEFPFLIPRYRQNFLY